MYYLRFTKVIIHHFMSKDPSIPRRNKINWHYVRDDSIFSTIKVVSRHQNTQQYGAMLPIELTNDEIRNTKAYKEYYTCATGEAVPKPKASARRKMSGSDTSITPLTTTTTPTTSIAVTPRLTAAAKGKQPAKAKSPSDPSESKHIDIEYHFIKEQVENGVIELYLVNTEYQLADLFTKALGRERIEFLINTLRMRSFMPKTLKQLMNEEDE
nr:ribonuclease H [Tanacetum cinerariifolium]